MLYSMFNIILHDICLKLLMQREKRSFAELLADSSTINIYPYTRKIKKNEIVNNNNVRSNNRQERTRHWAGNKQHWIFFYLFSNKKLRFLTNAILFFGNIYLDS